MRSLYTALILLLASLPSAAQTVSIGSGCLPGVPDLGGHRLATARTGTPSASAEEVYKGILAVAGSVPGSFGSYFRTSVQLGHPGGSAPVTGRMIFHRAGVAGSESDPFIRYTLLPNQVITYPDVLAEMGVSGLGSIDFAAPEDVALPVVSARVFNDAGAAGTSGFGQTIIDDISSVIEPGRDGLLITPVDPAKTRFNIGVRTIEDSDVTLILYDAAGVAISSITKSYPGTYFEQVGAESLLGPISSGQLIRIRSTGMVVVYGTTNDNTTNDPSLQMARVVPVF